MPIYEYLCLTCAHQFEQLISAAARIPACPLCGHKTKKLFSSFACKTGGKSFASDFSTGDSRAGDFSAPASSSKSCNTCSSRSCSTCH